MDIECTYPMYRVGLTEDTLRECCNIVVRLLDEVGFAVPHARFRDMTENKPGIRIHGERVHFSPELIRSYIDKFIANQRQRRARPRERAPSSISSDWTVTRLTKV